MASKRKPGTSLSLQQMRAAGLIVAGLSNEEVAREVGVHPCTVAHWRADRQFSGYVDLLQYQVQERIVDRLVKASTKALDVLEQQVMDPQLSWLQRVTVAGKILETLNALP